MNKFKPLIDKLDNEIDKLVSKYGMTKDIEDVNEDWVEFMHAYYTDYRGPEDDDAVIEMATEIYKHIQQIKFYHERPLHEHFNNMSVGQHGIAATGVVIVQRHENNIVLSGTDSELEEIRNKMKRSFNVDGKIIKKPRSDKPAGLYYNQLQGRHLVTLNITSKDYSNKALGIVTKRKRESDSSDIVQKKPKMSVFDFFFQDGKMFFLGDMKRELEKYSIPVTTKYYDGTNQLVTIIDLKYYSDVVKTNMVGKAVTAPSKPPPRPTPAPVPAPKPLISRRFKFYTFQSKIFIVGKHKHVMKLRKLKTKMPVIRKKLNDDDIDILIFHEVDRRNFEDEIKMPIESSQPLPDNLIPLLYQLYPNLKPDSMKKTNDKKTEIERERERQREIERNKKPILSLDDVMNDYNSHGSSSSSSDRVIFREFNLKTTISQDWYEFRGNKQYYLGWEHAIKNNVRKIVTNSSRYGIVIFAPMFFFYIAVKRDSKWTKHIKSKFIKSPSSNIYYTDDFKKRFLETPIKENFIYYGKFTFEFAKSSRHSNALIIWPRKKIIIRMEPHGSSTNAYNNAKCDSDLEHMFKSIPVTANYKYYGPSSFQRAVGPQAIESWKQNKFEKVKAKFGSKERLLQSSGFCMAWCLYFHTSIMLNSLNDFRDTYKRALEKGPNDLATDIRLFQSFIVDGTKEKFKDQYKKFG